MKGKPWEYLFFVDLQGHAEDEAVAKALGEASKVAHSHKILGSYPRASGVSGVARNAAEAIGDSNPSAGSRRERD
jgi:hypothetical protein